LYVDLVTKGCDFDIYQEFLLIDITSQAQSWLNRPDTNKGIALSLVKGSSRTFYFDAKESLLTANGTGVGDRLARRTSGSSPGPRTAGTRRPARNGVTI
jgi:hypothetical protein